MKKYIFIISLLLLVLLACNEEPAIEPNAEFSTKLVDNTAYAGESFYLYLDNTRGEFFSLYKGFTETMTYDPDDPTRVGEDISPDADSIAITYVSGGNYELTMVASSAGNWGDEIKRDVHTLELLVVDNRAEIVSLEVGGREGEITADNEILFYAHKNEDLTNERVRFITASSGAIVMVDGEEVSTGRFNLDFSAVNPGDDVGRPQVFEVKAPDGATETYTAQFILRDPGSEKRLYSISSDDFSGTFSIIEDAKEVLVEYYTGDELNVEILADVSVGATAEVDGTEVHEKEKNVDLSIAEAITVTAEDLSTQDYNFVLYEKEKITSFSFVGTDDGGFAALNPEIQGNVDFENRMISIEVPENLDLSNLVTSFEGITEFSVQIDGTALASGVTAFDYTLEESEDEESPASKEFTIEVYDGGTLVDTYMLLVTY